MPTRAAVMQGAQKINNPLAVGFTQVEHFDRYYCVYTNKLIEKHVAPCHVQDTGEEIINEYRLRKRYAAMFVCGEQQQVINASLCYQHQMQSS